MAALGIRLRREFLQLGIEMMFEGEALQSFVEKETQREIERIEKEQQQSEAEKIRQHELEMKTRDLELEREKNAGFERQISEGSASPRQAPYPQQGSIDPAMTFAVEPFNENLESIDDYLDRFETLAKLYELETTKWSLKLSLHLRNTPYEIYSKLPPPKSRGLFTSEAGSSKPLWDQC